VSFRLFPGPDLHFLTPDPEAELLDRVGADPTFLDRLPADPDHDETERHLDLGPSVTTRDGHLKPSPFPQRGLVRVRHAHQDRFQGLAALAATDLDTDGAKEEMLRRWAVKVVHVAPRKKPDVGSIRPRPLLAPRTLPLASPLTLADLLGLVKQNLLSVSLISALS
jgi:hypothetical protein